MLVLILRGKNIFLVLAKIKVLQPGLNFSHLAHLFSYLTCRASAAKTLKCFLLVIEKWALQVSLCSHLCIPY